MLKEGVRTTRRWSYCMPELITIIFVPTHTGAVAGEQSDFVITGRSDEGKKVADHMCYGPCWDSLYSTEKYSSLIVLCGHATPSQRWLTQAVAIIDQILYIAEVSSGSCGDKEGCCYFNAPMGGR